MSQLLPESIKPLGSRVFVKLDEKVDKTEGGIFLPDVAQRKQQSGTVIAVGPGGWQEDGTRAKVESVVGQRVLFSKHGPEKVNLPDGDYVILEDSQIYARLT